MPSRRAFAIVSGLALVIIYGYRTYLEARKQWSGLQSLWDFFHELAKSDPITLVLLAMGVAAIAAGTSDLWRNRHLRFEWSQTNPAVHPQSWETGEWVVYVRNPSLTKTINGVRVVLESYRRACPCTKSSSVRLGRPIWRQMTWQLSAWSHSVFEDATRAVSPAPGTVTGVHWLPRGNYQFKVRAFGQGSAPAVEQYILPFMKKRVCRWRPPLGGISWAPK